MIFELVVTSAKRVLQAGRSGFAPVMRTRGMHPDLQSRLEAISGYRHLYPQGDPRNPVIRSHCVVDSAAGKFSAMSRLLDAGSDYSGRSNKLAHHIACDANDLRAGLLSSPAAAIMSLETNGVFVSRWDGDPQEKSACETFTYPPVAPKKCVTWERLAGDAGWAGVLVERTLKATPTWIVAGADVDVLPLFAEALALIEPTKRWGVSFTTHALSDNRFLWTAAVDGSAEARAAREQSNAAVIDLTKPATLTEATPYIQSARGLADVPWKPRQDIPNTVTTDSRRIPAGTPAGPRADVPPAVRPPEAAAGPPSTRPGPPHLVTPPPIARARGISPTPLPLPLDRDSTPSSRLPLVAASILAGVLVATIVGLFIDDRLRGDSGIVRQLAHAFPRKAEPPPSSAYTSEGSEPKGQGAKHGKKRGDSRTSDENGSVKPADSNGPTKTPSVTVATLAEPGPPARPEPKNDAPPETSPASEPAKQMAEEPSATPLPKENKTNSPIPAAPKVTPISFTDFKKLVEKALHLPEQSIGDSHPTTGNKAAAPVRLITFEPAKSAPTDVRLALLQQTGQDETSAAPLVLQDVQVDGDRRSWKCCLGSDANTPLGSFVLAAGGLSFAPAEHVSSDILTQLAACCLLVNSTTPDECTFLQLSRPYYIPPVKLTLKQPDTSPRALLEGKADIDSPGTARLLEPMAGSHLSMQVTLKCDKGEACTSSHVDPLLLPISVRTYLKLPLEAGTVLAPCDLVLARHANGISVEALVNAFSDQELFEHLRRPIRKPSNINFEQHLWPFAREELNAVFSSQHESASAEAQKTRKPLLFVTLKNNLSPAGGKPGSPFKAYVDSLRTFILDSEPFTKAAEAAVDARHPPTPPPPEAAEKKGAAQPPSSDKSVTRDAAIAKEKESRFETWCTERVNELERRCATEAGGKPDSWPPADQYEYAALFLWHRIHRLEDVLAGLSEADESPIAIPAEAYVELKLVWPRSRLPEGASCHPETLLLQTQP